MQSYIRPEICARIHRLRREPQRPIHIHVNCNIRLPLPLSFCFSSSIIRSLTSPRTYAASAIILSNGVINTIAPMEARIKHRQHTTSRYGRRNAPNERTQYTKCTIRVFVLVMSRSTSSKPNVNVTPLRPTTSSTLLRDSAQDSLKSQRQNCSGKRTPLLSITGSWKRSPGAKRSVTK